MNIQEVKEFFKGLIGEKITLKLTDGSFKTITPTGICYYPGGKEIFDPKTLEKKISIEKVSLDVKSKKTFEPKLVWYHYEIVAIMPNTSKDVKKAIWKQ